MVDLSIITVTWNSADTIKRQIESVKDACIGISFEQFVVDNGSVDETPGIVSSLLPEGSFIANKKNLGFGAANNQVVNSIQGEFILFLNPDMVLPEKSLEVWVSWMKGNKEVGVSGCKLVNENGEVENNALPRRFPTWWNQLMIILKVPKVFPFVLNKYLYKGFDVNKEQTVDSVRGSCMLVRQKLTDKLGHAFDPRYYIWFEDVDLCKEAWQLNYKVVYTPIISAVDYVGQSFKKRNVAWKQWQLLKSMIKYFKKWGV